MPANLSYESTHPAPSRRVLLRAGGLVILTGLAVPGLPAPSQAATRSVPVPSSGDAWPAPATRRRAHHRRARTRTEAPEPMYYLHDGPKRVALTIDDGPSPVYTPQVLRLLDRYRITAAFSMIGQNAVAHPHVARQVADAGHLIVNHTWSHPDLAVMAPGEVQEEVTRGAAAIRRATGRDPHLFRAPYGAWSPAVLELCGQLNLTPLDWSVDPRDWSLPGVDAIVGNIMANTQTGSIILEHDGGGNRAETVAALSIVLPRLLAEGFRFRTP